MNDLLTVIGLVLLGTGAFAVAGLASDGKYPFQQKNPRLTVRLTGVSWGVYFIAIGVHVTGIVVV